MNRFVDYFISKTIRYRIVMLVVMPFVIVVLMTGERIVYSINNGLVLNQLSIIIGYAEVNSRLLSASMREKVLSYAALEEPSGKFDDLLRQERTKVDKSLLEVKEYVSSNESRLKKEADFYQLLQKSFDQIENLPSIREAVDKKLLRDAEGEVTARKIDGVVKSLMDPMQEVRSISARDEKLSIAFSAYYELLHAKDNAVTEAAIRLRVSAMDVLDEPPRYSRLREYVAHELKHLTEFEILVPESLKDYYRTHFVEHSLVVEIDKIRRERRNMFGVSHDLDPDYWFKASLDRLILLEDIDDKMVGFINETVDQEKHKLLTTAGIVLVLILMFTSFTLYFSFRIVRSINQPLRKIVENITYMAESKDMERRLESGQNDEIAEVSSAFNQLIKSFKRALREVREQNTHVSKTIDQVDQAMHEAKQKSSELDVATETVTAALGDMGNSINEVSHIAVKASESVQGAHQGSMDSVSSASESQTEIRSLIDEVEETRQSIERLSGETEQIGSVVEVIQSIAEQTNLLALNASIEAAKAGHEGKGFAVVADEVKVLAGQTQESTQKIREQIESLQNRSKQAAERMNALTGKGHASIASVQTSTEKIDSLNEHLESITDLTNQIAAAMEEQSAVTSDILKQSNVIKENSVHMTEHMEQTEKAGEALTQANHEMASSVSIFKIDRA